MLSAADDSSCLDLGDWPTCLAMCRQGFRRLRAARRQAVRRQAVRDRHPEL